jgi:hypothetical protein
VEGNISRDQVFRNLQQNLHRQSFDQALSGATLLGQKQYRSLMVSSDLLVDTALVVTKR